MWSDARDIIMELFDEDDEFFPKKCPCCGHNEGHIFFYKHKELDHLGSAWAWCSNCKEYSHSRCIIPDWWKNMDNIQLNQLHAIPDILDKVKNNIDAWVNMLRNKKQ